MKEKKLTKYLTNQTSKIIDKIYNKEKLTFDELIVMIRNGHEMQFFLKRRKFGMTQFDGYEFYEWNKEEGYQSYPTIKKFADNVNIDGVHIKNLWDQITRIGFAD